MKSIKNIFITILVLTGTLVTPKTHSKSLFLKTENYPFYWDLENCDRCPFQNQDQHSKFTSKFPLVLKDHTSELGLQPTDSLSNVIDEMNCSQKFRKITKDDLNPEDEVLQNSNCVFNIGKIESRDIVEVSAAEKNSIIPKNKEIELIAKTIWGEGRGESYEGKVAIGNVIVNRYNISQRTKKSDWWGNTIEQIILHPYQFSCHNHNDPNKSKIAKLTTADYQYRESLKIARGILSGTIKDNTFGATHYFAYKVVRPRWASSMKKTKRIGNHDFYKN